MELWTDSADRLMELVDVTLVAPDNIATRPARIAAVRSHDTRALVKFEGIDAPEQLRDIQNWTIEIPESDARELEDGEYFLHDLAGLTLIDSDGRERGVVIEAYEGGSGILLSVKGTKGTYEVPFAAEICREIDLKKKTITVMLPEGLDELDRVAD